MASSRRSSDQEINPRSSDARVRAISRRARVGGGACGESLSRACVLTAACPCESSIFTCITPASCYDSACAANATANGRCGTTTLPNPMARPNIQV